MSENGGRNEFRARSVALDTQVATLLCLCIFSVLVSR
jgi:hypothetical protein